MPTMATTTSEIESSDGGGASAVVAGPRFPAVAASSDTRPAPVFGSNGNSLRNDDSNFGGGNEVGVNSVLAVATGAVTDGRRHPYGANPHQQQQQQQQHQHHTQSGMTVSSDGSLPQDLQHLQQVHPEQTGYYQQQQQGGAAYRYPHHQQPLRLPPQQLEPQAYGQPQAQIPPWLQSQLRPQQQQQWTVPPSTNSNDPLSAPWTLGSTDGSYALRLAVAMQQRQRQHQELQNSPTSTTEPSSGGNGQSSSSAPAPAAGSSSCNAPIDGQQQRASHPPSASLDGGGGGGGGGTLRTAMEAAVASSSSPSSIVPPPPRHLLDTRTGADGGGNGGGAAIAPSTGRASSSDRNAAAAAAAATATSTTTTAVVDRDASSFLLAGLDPTVAVEALARMRSLYQERLFRQPSASVEACLAAACEVESFDIAEMWLRTGPKTHQLTNSHLRPTALEDSVRNALVDVYYGSRSAERTHRLSPALCKRAKEASDVVWVTADTAAGAEALRCSISNVRTAVAVPVCHETSNTNVTVIFFSIRRICARPVAVEFLVHMALASGAASVSALTKDGSTIGRRRGGRSGGGATNDNDDDDATSSSGGQYVLDAVSRSERRQRRHSGGGLDNGFDDPGGSNHDRHHRHRLALQQQPAAEAQPPTAQQQECVSVTGAPLDLQWRQLQNVEYLTDGGNSWIHTAVLGGRPVVVKTLKPECQDVALAINEIEGELAVHSRLRHRNLCELVGAGTTTRGVRFVVLERLDGGTLTQMLGYDTRIRDRRRRFWRRKQFSFVDVLRIARSIAEAMAYCHEDAVPGSVCMHRDLKPDNIGFTLDGTVKILDFGLSRIIEDASADSHEVYTMSGETGSLRYMAPEVAEGLPYNCRADVYSFGIILWEINASKKPFEGLNRELFYERVVHGGERPVLSRKWPKELTALMAECWDADMRNRPSFRHIVARLDAMLTKEKGGGGSAANYGMGNNNNNHRKKLLPRLAGMIDRHSTWF